MKEKVKKVVDNFLSEGTPGEFIITVKPNGDILCEKKETFLYKKK